MKYRTVGVLTSVAAVIVAFGWLAYDPARAQETGPSPLFSALQRGTIAEVDRALRDGANANATDAEGTPALMAATLFGNEDLVDLLLKRGADPNRPDAAGSTALMWAAHDARKVTRLLAHGADVNARSKTGRTPLHVAAAYPGTLDTVRLLVARGADITAQDQGRATPLTLATRSSDVEVVRYLVGRGLDPKALSPTARLQANRRLDPPTVAYLMSKDMTPIPETMTWAAMSQPTALVRRWLAAGGDVNAVAPARQYSRTPLMTAVTSEASGAETVQLLLEKGADPDARTPEGETALDWAIYKGDSGKIAVL